MAPLANYFSHLATEGFLAFPMSLVRGLKKKKRSGGAVLFGDEFDEDFLNLFRVLPSIFDRM